MKSNIATAVISIALAFAVAYFVFKDDNQDNYRDFYDREMQRRDSIYKADSTALVVKFNEVLLSREKTLDSARMEAKKQTQITKNLENKIKYLNSASQSVIDSELDSILAGH